MPKVGAGLIISVIFSETKWAAQDKPRAAAGKNSYFNPRRTCRPIQYVFSLSSHIKTESSDNEQLRCSTRAGCWSAAAGPQQPCPIPSHPPHLTLNELFYTAQLLSFIRRRRISFIFINSLKESYGPTDTGGCMDPITFWTH